MHWKIPAALCIVWPQNCTKLLAQLIWYTRQHWDSLDSAGLTHDPQLTGVRGGENSAGSCKNYLQPKNVNRKTKPQHVHAWVTTTTTSWYWTELSNLWILMLRAVWYRAESVATQSNDEPLIMMSRYLRVPANWPNNGENPRLGGD